MIDIKSEYPVVEDFLSGIQRCTTQINEALGDIQYLCKRFTDGNFFITSEQVAQLLKCDVESIPPFRRYRGVSNRGYIYKYSDVMDWMEKRVVGKI